MIWLIVGIISIIFGLYMVVGVSEKNIDKIMKAREDWSVEHRIKRARICGAGLVVIGIVLLVMTY